VSGRSRYAAYGVCVDEGRILLTRIWDNDPGAGKWTLPGGKIEWLEDPVDAVHRELWEEAGLAGEIVRPLGVDAKVFPPWRGHDEMHAVRFVFEVRATGTPRVMEVGGSTVDAAWFDISEAKEMDTTTLVHSALAMLVAADVA
jgi:ADP-ribose pyrophosphatase YjhB (NUDIX family)